MIFRKGRNEMDMISGPVLPKLLLFGLPLIASSMLQLMFNAADVIIVGRYNGETALAAVGSTGALINLIITVFMGLSVGTNVVVARERGAGRYEEVSKAVHTSIMISLIGGVILGIFGFLMSGTFLHWMGSPDDVLPLATVYMQIYFLGLPATMLYNFGSAVLRAVGDTRRPMIFLTIAGVVNVILNLFFVIVFHMGVAGVALATAIAQTISATLVLLSLIQSRSDVHVNLKQLRIDREKTLEMIKIGIPAGLQGACVSVSNVLIQSTVNSFGSIAVAGNSVGANLESFAYVAMNAMYQAAITFTSQNVGAKHYARLRRVCRMSVLASAILGFLVSWFMLLCDNALVGLYTPVPEVVEAACQRMWILLPAYFTVGIMEVMCGSLRGLGTTVVPMLVSVLGMCAFRVGWVLLVLPMFDPALQMQVLYVSYPASWIITGIAHTFCYLYRLKKRFPVSAGLDAPAGSAA